MNANFYKGKWIKKSLNLLYKFKSNIYEIRYISAHTYIYIYIYGIGISAEIAGRRLNLFLKNASRTTTKQS